MEGCLSSRPRLLGVLHAEIRDLLHLLARADLRGGAFQVRRSLVRFSWGFAGFILGAAVVASPACAVIGSISARSQVAHSQPVRVEPPSPLRLRVAGTGGLLYEVTAYSHGCIMPNGPEGPARRAADGRWPRTDHTIAADTSLHPFGSELLIDGVGLRTVGDRGSAIKGRKVDLFVDSCTEARRFGRRWLRVRVPKATTEEAAQ